jgi:hypothetical protein
MCAQRVDKQRLPVRSQPLLEDIRAILRDARRQTWATVNTLMVQAYWHIGRRIVQEEQQGKERADYGAALIRNLARDLGEEFGRGVSIANLKNFRQFYLTFPDENFLYALRRELTWTHRRLVMQVDTGPPWNHPVCRKRRNDGALLGTARKPAAFRLQISPRPAQRGGTGAAACARLGASGDSHISWEV